MTTTVIGDNIINDADNLDDFNENHKIKLYKKAVKTGQQCQKELDKIFIKEREKAEGFLENTIAEVLNNLEDITDCRIEKVAVKVMKEFSRSNPREKEYKVKVSLVTDNPEF